MKYTPSYRESVTLDGGTRVTIRLIRPDDKAALAAAFEKLSHESRYQRFHAEPTSLSEETLRFLTEVDGHDHFAIVASTDSLDMKTEVGLGVARFVRLDELDAEGRVVAEAAITVADSAQRLGVGRVLLRGLTEAAIERGVGVFRAEVLATNQAMRSLLRDVGALETPDGEDVIVFDIPLVALAGGGSDQKSALRRLLRAAASLPSALFSRRERLARPSK